jgi:lysophospholipase L1-like esterase
MNGQLHRSAVVAALLAMGAACSSDVSGRGDGSGGSISQGSGGTPGSGGAPATGGATGSGGVRGTGGVPGSGGQVGSGGNAPGTGGSSVSSGRSGSGGASTSGGSTGAGGATASGGATGAAGNVGSGGNASSGGTPGARDAATTGPETGKSDGPVGGGTGGFDPCPATGNCKILPLGDSITAGAGAQPGDNGGYRTELFTKAVTDEKHITFVGSLTSGPATVAGVAFPKNHEGHIGYKIDQISALATTAQGLKDSPHIVLLLAGTNDEGYADSAAGASDRLGLLIDKIVAALPDSLLVVASIYPFPGCKATGYTPTQCAANVATYDAAIPGVIKQRTDKGKHVLFVDMSGLPSTGLSTDGVHPNATEGYPWLGDNWYGVIKPYLH